MPSPDHIGKYRIIASGVIRQRLAELRDRAKSTKHGSSYAASVTEIFQALAENPQEFGDRLYDLHNFKLKIHRRIKGCVLVEFGIDESRQLVYLRKIDPFPDDAY
jgi:hypothetical protein